MNSSDYTIIKNANVWTEGRFLNADVEIRNGMVTALDPVANSPLASDRHLPESAEIINAKGMYLLPGLVDMHVHFREPGYSYKETIKTGSEAAAAGGFTTVCTMPNLNPAPDSPENLLRQLEIIRKDAVIEVLPYATITRLRMGKELVDYLALAPDVCGFSDDGTGVQDDEIMHRAMTEIAKTGKILAAHCEVEALLNSGYIHDGIYARDNNHRGICSESEWKEVERDIKIAEETGCRLHVCHISTKESVSLIREAKARGVRVTCETGPHYLTFCDEDLREEGRFKMNPPIRSRADRDALREGVADGTIDVISTDHAPHSESEKSKGLEKSAMGVVGLETSFAAIYTTMVKPGLISMEQLAHVMSTNARAILGLPAAGGIKPGVPADLTLLSGAGTSIVDPATFRSLGKATPYAGLELSGNVAATMYAGNWVYRALV